MLLKIWLGESIQLRRGRENQIRYRLDNIKTAQTILGELPGFLHRCNKGMR